jgi:4-aminobutyrate aminotransferase and related aminotransferases
MHPDVYRGIWGGQRCRYSPIQTTRYCSCPLNQCEASNKFYEQLVNAFQYNVPITGAAALIAESIQGVSGVKEFPRYFLRRAYELIKSNNGLFISDEVRVGIRVNQRVFKSKAFVNCYQWTANPISRSKMCCFISYMQIAAPVIQLMKVNDLRIHFRFKLDLVGREITTGVLKCMV